MYSIREHVRGSFLFLLYHLSLSTCIYKSLVSSKWYYPSIASSYKKSLKLIRRLSNTISVTWTVLAWHRFFKIFQKHGDDTFYGITFQNYSYEFHKVASLVLITVTVLDCQAHMFLMSVYLMYVQHLLHNLQSILLTYNFKCVKLRLPVIDNFFTSKDQWLSLQGALIRMSIILYELSDNNDATHVKQYHYLTWC